jgi:PDZ domain-containing protein
LKYPVTTRVQVAGAIAKTSAAGIFKKGDVILAVNGVKILDISQIKAQLVNVKPGQSVEVEYSRAEVLQKVKVITAAGSGGRPLLGISAGVVPQLPFKIEIAAGEIGGPSAGLLFTLGVVEKLTPGSLAKKRVITGTGTITPDGKVGAIGGIDEKIRGAKRAGATLFLAPLDNCQDITVQESGLTVVGVRDVGAAVMYLENAAAVDSGIDRKCGK